MKNALHASRILKKPSSATPRFVLMIEIPDNVASELKARKVSRETRAYEVAFETARADQSNKPAHRMTLMSCTRGKVKDPESLVNLI